MKMRIKARYAMNLIKRSLRALRKRFELRLGQEAVSKLDSPQVVEDHGAVSRVKRAARVFLNPRSAKWSTEISCILLMRSPSVNSAALRFSRHAAKKATHRR